MAEGRRRPHHLRALVGLASALALATTACGTRISHGNIVAAWNRGGTSSSRAASGTAAGDLTDQGATAGAGAEIAGSAEGTAAGGGAAAGAAGAAAGRGGAAAGAAVAGTKPAFLLGNVGSYSGLSSSQSGARDTLQVWVKFVNDHGGVNGHPVRLVLADDGGDSNRAAALVKDMVENQHVLAFLGNQSSLTLDGYSQYLKDKHIPVIGGDVNSIEWNNNPMLFPESAAIDAQLLGIPVVGSRAGKKNLGLLYCAEADACKHVDDLLFAGGGAQRAGMNPAYHAQVSIVQPSFTSECLNASNAHVDAFYIASDTASVGRVASDCTRQGFKPMYLAGSTTLANELANDPNLDGLGGVQGTFPWFENDTPATQEYQAAIHKYAPGLNLNSAAAQGWTAGKLFEKVGAKFGDGAVTTAQIFDGLYAVKNETLGGLAPALSFVRDQPAPRANCVFPINIQGRKWVAPPGHPTICSQLP